MLFLWSVSISSVYFSGAPLSLLGAFHSFKLLVLVMHFIKQYTATKFVTRQTSWCVCMCVCVIIRHRRFTDAWLWLQRTLFECGAWLKRIMFYAHALKESNHCVPHSVNVPKLSIHLILFKNSISDSPKHTASPLQAGNVAGGNNYSEKHKKHAHTHTVC